MTTAADPKAYPAPRKRAAGAATTAAEESGPVPRTRVFPFFLAFGATSRRAFSTPRLIGPAIIKGIELYSTHGASPPAYTVEIGTGATPVLESAVAIDTPRPFTVLTELLDPFNGIAGTAGDGIPMHTIPSYTASYERPLDLIVTDAEFFLVLAVQNPSAFAAELSGRLRVIEAVSRDALRFFL
jgi:hypothetical protein